MIIAQIPLDLTSHGLVIELDLSVLQNSAERQLVWVAVAGSRTARPVVTTREASAGAHAHAPSRTHSGAADGAGPTLLQARPSQRQSSGECQDLVVRASVTQVR